MPAQSSTIFPDLTAPPGWIGVPFPPQVRLIPPGTTMQTAKATIIVSPIAARTPQMPPPAQLVQAAVEAESARSLDVLEQSGPEKAPSDAGLDGIAFTLRAREQGQNADQGRIYVIYHDDSFLYGINYMAFGATYTEHLATFWKVARSIRPFRGRVVPPSPLPTDGD
jgi:hypothetical protein